MLAISEEYKLNPEALEFTDTYLATLDLRDTCEQLGISEEDGVEFLRKKEVKRFIDAAFLEQGYMNRFKIVDLMNKAIESKIEEAEESGMFGKESIMEMLKFMQQMRMDQIKAETVKAGNIKNIQNNNYGSNLGGLLEKIAK